jgi:hypothetical protein
MTIRYFYPHGRNKSCIIYSTKSKSELKSWGERHNMNGKSTIIEDGKTMPHYLLGNKFRARGKPVNENQFNADLKAWKRSVTVLIENEVVPTIFPIIPAQEMAPATVAEGQAAPPAPTTTQSYMIDWDHPIVISDPENWTPPRTKTTGVFLVTPELARRFIEFARAQRPLKQDKVLRLAMRMETNWTYTHQGLSFDENGDFNDGNHRMHALILADKTLPFEVTFGMEVRSFEVIDDRPDRDVADLVTIRHRAPIKNIKKMCAIGRAMLLGLDPGNVSKIDKLMQSEFVEWYLDDIRDYYELVKSLPAWMVTAPVFAAFANSTRGLDGWPGGHGCRRKADVLQHVARFGTQEWYGTDDPMKALAMRIQRMRTVEKKQASGEDTRRDLYGMALNALRMCLSGESGSRVYVGSVEWGAENDHGKRPRVKPFTGKEQSHVESST